MTYESRDQRFPTALRGYDPAAVDRYVEDAGYRIAALERERAELIVRLEAASDELRVARTRPPPTAEEIAWSDRIAALDGLLSAVAVEVSRRLARADPEARDDEHAPDPAARDDHAPDPAARDDHAPDPAARDEPARGPLARTVAEASAVPVEPSAVPAALDDLEEILSALEEADEWEPDERVPSPSPQIAAPAEADDEPSVGPDEEWTVRDGLWVRRGDVEPDVRPGGPDAALDDEETRAGPASEPVPREVTPASADVDDMRRGSSYPPPDPDTG